MSNAADAKNESLHARAPNRQFGQGRPTGTASSNAIALLRERFPVVRRLAGDDTFEAMAADFARRNVPDPARLTALFPAFVETFGPARPARYLGDVARLELAFVRARHTPDVVPIVPLKRNDSRVFQTRSRLRLHPSFSLVVSDFPIIAIWEAYRRADRIVPVQHWTAESALVLRPKAAVDVLAVPHGGGRFITALARGLTLAEALAQTAAADGRFDADANVELLWNCGLVIGIEEPACGTDLLAIGG